MSEIKSKKVNEFVDKLLTQTLPNYLVVDAVVLSANYAEQDARERALGVLNTILGEISVDVMKSEFKNRSL